MIKKIVVLFLGTVGIAALSVLIYKGNANFLLYGLAAFLTTIILTALLVLLVVFAKKAKTPAPSPAEKKPAKKPEKKGSWGGWAVAGIILLLLGAHVGYKLFAPKAPVVCQQIPICTGNYDFSHIELRGKGKEPLKVVVNFRPDCICEVSLPPCANYRTRSTADHKIRFIDGAEYMDGPGKQTWFGVHRGIFKVRGLKEAGTLEIYLEKT